MEKKSKNGWGSRFNRLIKPGGQPKEPPSPVVPLFFFHSWCVGCSACTLTCEAVRNGSAPSWFEPKQRFQIPLSGDSAATTYPCETCGHCTATCPVGVPLHP